MEAKKIIITGGATRIGAAIAKSFMSHNRSKVVNRQLLNKFVDLVK